MKWCLFSYHIHIHLSCQRPLLPQPMILHTNNHLHLPHPTQKHELHTHLVIHHWKLTTVMLTYPYLLRILYLGYCGTSWVVLFSIQPNNYSIFKFFVSVLLRWLDLQVYLNRSVSDPVRHSTQGKCVKFNAARVIRNLRERCTCPFLLYLTFWWTTIAWNCVVIVTLLDIFITVPTYRSANAFCVSGKTRVTCLTFILAFTLNAILPA